MRFFFSPEAHVDYQFNLRPRIQERPEEQGKQEEKQKREENYSSLMPQKKKAPINVHFHPALLGKGASLGRWTQIRDLEPPKSSPFRAWWHIHPLVRSPDPEKRTESSAAALILTEPCPGS